MKRFVGTLSVGSWRRQAVALVFCAFADVCCRKQRSWRLEESHSPAKAKNNNRFESEFGTEITRDCYYDSYFYFYECSVLPFAH